MIVGGQTRGWVKAVFHFSKLVVELKRRQGSRGLALFLKANLLLLQRLVSGSRLLNPREAGVAVATTNRGVPRWIPVIHRKRLLRGDRPVIIFYFGILSLYRVLDFKGKLSLSTVTAPGVDIPESLISEFESFVSTKFLSWIKRFNVSPYKGVRDREDSGFWGQPKSSPGYLAGPIRLVDLSPRWKWMFTSGPNSTYSKLLAVGNAWIDMIAIHSRPALFSLLEHFREQTGGSSLTWLPWFEEVITASLKWSELCFETQRKSGKTPEWKPTEPYAGGSAQYHVGALSVVEEPGKKRIVAMVDIWTQWALYPLHRFIFDRILGKLPQDGTFNQQKPVKALLERAKEAGRTHFWSYDLSAATDRLPIRLQILVLAAFTHLGYASCWAALLTERDYRTPKEYATTFGRGASTVRYAVGQPMGAYSSWGMLALTHHALVQFSAWKVGHRAWFPWYAVLGDDVVICDRDVAASYVSLMGTIGVGIGFHKSIISDNTSLEFAKRFYHKGVEVNPLSLAGIAVGWLGPGFVPEVVASVQARLGVSLTLYQIARYLGIGFRSASAASNRLLTRLPKLLSSSLLLLLRPGAPFGAASLLDWYLAVTMTGGAKGKVKYDNEEKLFRVIWAEAVDTVLGPALGRLKTVLTGLFISPARKSKGGKEIPAKRYFKFDFLSGIPTPEYQSWFKSLLSPLFMRRYRGAIDEAGSLLQKAMKVWTRERDLKQVLQLIELALSKLALVPKEVGLQRRDESDTPVTDSSVLAVLLPRSVKRWRGVAKFVDRKGLASYRRRRNSAPARFSSRVLKLD
jgi:hypothetical protein